MMRAKLSKLSGHSEATAQTRAQRHRQPVQTSSAERGKPSSLRVILALLIQNPGLFSLIDAESRAELEREEKAGPLARKLFAILDERPSINSGGLLERFRGEPEEKLVRTLSVMEIPLSESDTQTEFRHTLDKFVSQVKNQLREQRLEWLEQKAASVGFAKLDEAEREEYRRLMSQKRS